MKTKPKFKREQTVIHFDQDLHDYAKVRVLLRDCYLDAFGGQTACRHMRTLLLPVTSQRTPSTGLPETSG
jgi:hypothetical protein